MKRNSARGGSARQVALELRGQPNELTGFFRPARPLAVFCPLESDLPMMEGNRRLVAQAVPAGANGLTWVSVAVPDSTPPGTYRGVLRSGDLAQPVEIEVDPLAQVRLLPPGVEAEASRGGELAIQVQLVNIGNVYVEVAAGSAIELEDSTGFARALRRAASARPEMGERPLELAGEEFAASRGGVGRLRVAEGSGRLKPGEVRRVRATLAVPDDLRPGRVYSGSWELAGTSFSLSIKVRTAGKGAPSKK
ncbi:MAG: hypothetical protein JF888_09460 [Candidatus Dormibacteraeota bacterium]|uniref:Uncharacterized protein n=1 Tax=Candidatus Dormiibacter inghamiae TaxID=3127013 RepID=A0A934KIN5_9BACT|nr:hypothetical protein [Candidatus Dormibacteraeota bacterium]MBJ7606783.1 hypothetical protein [Candidatus Dormibacteraeota bacterium]